MCSGSFPLNEAGTSDFYSGGFHFSLPVGFVIGLRVGSITYFKMVPLNDTLTKAEVVTI